MMKKYIILIIACLTSILAGAQVQPDPAHWAYGLKKLNGNIYEVHLQVTIDKGWHIYAQKQTDEFIGTATKFTFTKAPNLVLMGIPKEVGKKETYELKEAGIKNYEYANQVDFVQKMAVKPGIKEITGNITYQTCTHDHCLPEKTISFNVPIP